jgi:hypothetical protein
MFLLFKEAIAVGILLLIISIPIMHIQRCILPGDTASPQKYYVSTVIIGVIFHLLCEFSGLNKYYCKNGNACIKKD